MKTFIVFFTASLLLLAAFEAHADVGLVKNRRLLSDNGMSYSATNIDDDDEPSSPEQNSHHYWTQQDPPKYSTPSN